MKGDQRTAQAETRGKKEQENDDAGQRSDEWEDADAKNTEDDGDELGDLYPTSYETAQSTLSDYAITPELLSIAENRGITITYGPGDYAIIPEVFSSKWLLFLHNNNILLDPLDELDWSGRGQHVEYGLQEEGEVPLKAEKILGHSATAIVESVMCRRIRLARKKILCNRRLSKEDAITEVKHLLRCQHSHVVRVVGTYTLRKDLAILLYPAAEWSLDIFMDETLEMRSPGETILSESRALFRQLPDGGTDTPRHKSLWSFFGCLSHAVDFLHGQAVKHMDIKPKNLLVREVSRLTSGEAHTYKIYIADFGIARSYQSFAESETDSPTAFTRTYAAPEVVLQDIRGFKADIFSLGCVFVEMFATLASSAEVNEKDRLRAARFKDTSDSSFQASIDDVLDWFSRFSSGGLRDFGDHPLLVEHRAPSLPEVTCHMLSREPDDRPTAEEVSRITKDFRCRNCDDGPEPFEAARPISA